MLLYFLWRYRRSLYPFSIATPCSISLTLRTAIICDIFYGDKLFRIFIAVLLYKFCRHSICAAYWVFGCLNCWHLQHTTFCQLNFCCAICRYSVLRHWYSCSSTVEAKCNFCNFYLIQFFHCTLFRSVNLWYLCLILFTLLCSICLCNMFYLWCMIC